MSYVRKFDAARYRDFRSRHPKLQFTPDFNSSLEKEMLDLRLALRFRQWALIKLTAWGNFSERCEDANGNALTAADFGRILDVDRRRASEVLVLWKELGYLRMESDGVYPLDDPPVDALLERDPNVRYVPDNLSAPLIIPSPEFRLFAKPSRKFKRHLERWAAQHPEVAAEWERVQIRDSEIKREILTSYKSMSGTLRTNGGSRPERSGHDVRNAADNLSGTQRTNGDPILIENLKSSKELSSYSQNGSPSVSKTAELASRIRQIVADSKIKIRDEQGKDLDFDDHSVKNVTNVLVAAPAELHDLSLSHFKAECHRYAKRDPKKLNGWGIVVYAMKTAVEAAQAGKEPPADAAEEIPEAYLPTHIKRLRIQVQEAEREYPGTPELEQLRALLKREEDEFRRTLMQEAGQA